MPPIMLSLFLTIALVAVVLGLWHRRDYTPLRPTERIERQLSIMIWLLAGNIILTAISAVAR